MSKVCIYNRATGVIRLCGEFPDVANLQANLQPDEDFTAANADPRLSYIRDGEVLDYPARPGPWAVWDGASWIDPRPADQAEEEAAAEMQARRAKASLSKLEFAKRVSHPETGVIQPSSGMILLDGDVPPELAGMVASLPAPDQFALIMDLKGASQFDRLNPFVVEAGKYLNLTDEQMDAVFGI